MDAKDDLLDVASLEDEFYSEGHDLGIKDGRIAGQVEGKVFGIEKGFEKALEMGRLRGRASCWMKRLSTLPERNALSTSEEQHLAEPASNIPQHVPKSIVDAMMSLTKDARTVMPLPPNVRLEKHINALLSITDPKGLPKENDDDAVANFDNNLKRAMAKVKLITSMIGEPWDSENPADKPDVSSQKGDGSGNIEDLSSLSQEDEDGDSDHIFLAVDIKERGTIGCAYYIAREERLYCMDDVKIGGLEIIERLKIEIQPTILLLSPRVEHAKGSGSRDRLGSLVEGNETAPTSYQIEIRPPQEFSYDGARSKLVGVDSLFQHQDHGINFFVPGESSIDNEVDLTNLGSTDRQGKLLRLSSWVDFTSRVSVGCLGAVLACIQRRRGTEYLPEDPAAEYAYRVKSVEMFSLKGTMFINADTLVALQIFLPESHPNAFNQGPGSQGAKESLSVYGLFQHLARTPQGKVRLRQCFLRPTLDSHEINERLDFVSALVRPENAIPLQKLSKSMSKIKNIRTTMVHLHKGINGGSKGPSAFRSGVWATLLAFAYHTIDILDTLGEVTGELSMRVRAFDAMNRFDLHAVGKMIHDIVDLEASVDQHRTVVKYGVSEDLDNVRRVYDGMDDLLGKTALAIVRSLPQDVDINLNVIYFPQLGFHITVPINHETGQAVYSGGEELWERMFTTQNQVYFKDSRMQEMDETIGDLWGAICEKEIEISYDLAQHVLEYEKMLVSVSDLCGELDLLLALAQGAVQNKLVRPKVGTSSNTLDIKAGRHLLQEMMVPSFVPNDLVLAGGSDSNDSDSSPLTGSHSNLPTTLLLTGPNYSGKTIYLKTAAHITYLAHLGSFVPAASATVPLTDAILTRLSTRETISRIESAFLLDLQQIAQCLTLATPRSLVLIDEFGKGTDAADGAGLCAGVLQHFLDRPREEAPKILAATHFHELFELGFITPPPPTSPDHGKLAFGHMAIQISPIHLNPTPRPSPLFDQVVYLYTFQPGLSTESFGTVCAALNGVPEVIVDRARALGDVLRRGEDLVGVMCGGMDEEERRGLERAEGVARGFLEVDFEGGVEEDVVDWEGVLGAVVGEGADERGDEDRDGRQVVEELEGSVEGSVVEIVD
ncbi:MAG: hypothetical protein Q9227_005947 [Pyrenula ochraceoflavens]